MKDKKVLLINSNYEVAECIYKELRKFAFTVFYSESGKNVIEIILEELIDIIIIDINLKEKGAGFNIIERINKEKKHSINIPILFTAEEEDEFGENIAKAYNFGGHDFVVSPCRRKKELIWRVKSNLNEKRQSIIRNVNVFLSSSGELINERDNIEQLYLKENIKQDKFIYEVKRFENHFPVKYNSRFQDFFNNLVNECDIFIMIISEKLGKYTKEEFSVAYDVSKKQSNKVDKAILILFKKCNAENKEVKEFRDYLENTEKLFYEYSDENDLIMKIENFNKGFLKSLPRINDL